MAEPLEGLERKLGHSFANRELLKRALTHASVVGEAGGPQPPSTYERLEFLGDRVLGLVVADMLERHFPAAPEGELSRRLAKLVSGDTCAKVGREMELHRFVRAGGGVRTGARASDGLVSDVCEAVIGALYRDGDMDAARPVVERFWRPRMETMKGPLRDAKTELQEWAHRRGLDAPVYTETLRTGPDHAPEFEIAVKIPGVADGAGKGLSKREAEHEAAASVLRREGVWSGA